MDKSTQNLIRGMAAGNGVLWLSDAMLSGRGLQAGIVQSALQAVCPEKLLQTPVGSEVGKQPEGFVAGLSNGRVDRVKVEVTTASGIKEEVWVASPVILTLVGDREDALTAFLQGQASGSQVAALPFNGAYFEALPKGMMSDFMQAYGNELAKSPFFSANQRLDAVGALAREFYRLKLMPKMPEANRQKIEHEAMARVMFRLLTHEAKIMAGNEARTQVFTEALLAVSALFETGQGYAGKSMIIGKNRSKSGSEIEIYVPRDLSRGALRRYISFWENQDGFELVQDLKDQMRKLQLRDFRIGSAA
ncbi:MAG: hypothetical protein HGA76_03120 [Candidatus Firestonebacteria bacterium]|nr:hypothetical protein [Candidatus Firestonebacteria bacterium]